MTQIIRPSAVSYQHVDLSWMVGRSVTGVVYEEPGVRYFTATTEIQTVATNAPVFDPAVWRFALGPDASIGVEGLWRIVQNGHVVLTADDHRRQFGLPAPIDAVARSAELLAERKIAAVELRDGTADILIELDGGIRLEIIAASSGYECWQMRDPFGTEYFAQGGGQICKFKA